MTHRRSKPLIFVLGIVLGAALLTTPRTLLSAPGHSDRWYEVLRDGQKLGHARVVWAPSTWERRPTVHDTTTITERSVRNMLGIRDVFEVVMTIDLERSDDGTLWWQRIVVEEAGRVTTEELRWTGDGYEHVSRLEGEEKTQRIPLDEPVMTDAEAFLGSRIRARSVAVGDTFDLRLLDLRARKVRLIRLTIADREEVVDMSAPVGSDGQPAHVPCFKVLEEDPESGGRSTMWIDDEGAYVRLVGEGGSLQHRVPRERAEAAPTKPAENRITTPATPVLERIMSADHLYLDLHLQGDPNRALPSFPESPWSRVLEVKGSDEEGWVLELRLDAYDDVGDARTTIPVAAEGFERELEATVLMPCRHERVQAVAREIIGDETDARRAAHALARWVYASLTKQSPKVGQASALQILEQRGGDCSEHALLFTTLCRAVGIPARLCSGYVCVASDWGAHSWVEIWIGDWIGTDPTTGEIGTGARHLFFGYPDRPDSFPGLVSARVRGRMRFVATRIQEGDDDYDLTDPVRWRLSDDDQRRYVHVLAGIDVREVPENWTVRMIGANRARLRSGVNRVDVLAVADQGATLDNYPGESATFAGAPAKLMSVPGMGMGVFVHSRRRIFQVAVRSKQCEELLPLIEQMLAPTFAASPTAPPATSEGAGAEKQAEEKQAEGARAPR